MKKDYGCIVRNNLMYRPGYSPYCGSNKPRNTPGGCHNPRTNFNGTQFVCPYCNWVSNFDAEFINKYKQKWNL